MTQIQQYSYRVSDAEQTRELGEQLAHHLRAGDLIMLRGGLGAGKTTFTQGIGRGLQVRGTVASPTFIVARVHPSLVGGPDLIHADAYRIRDLDDLETLDLDSTIDQAVTVVEWGEGKTEAMSDARLEIEVRRASGERPHVTVMLLTLRVWMTVNVSSHLRPTRIAGTVSLMTSHHSYVRAWNRIDL